LFKAVDDFIDDLSHLGREFFNEGLITFDHILHGPGEREERLVRARWANQSADKLQLS
jgi:hypothetical protein